VFAASSALSPQRRNEAVCLQQQGEGIDRVPDDDIARMQSFRGDTLSPADANPERRRFQQETIIAAVADCGDAR
jgi:hypothetical protein